MFLFAVIVISVSCLTPGRAFKYTDCGGKDAVVNFDDVSIQPQPLVFGEKVAVAATMRLKEAVTGGLSNIEMHRLIRVFGVTIPLKIPCVLNSCSTDLCADIGPKTIVCDWLSQANRTCGCPLGPDTIKSNDYMIKVPYLGSFYSMLLNGDYRIKWTWLDQSKEKEIGCVTADLSFGSKAEQIK